MQPNEIVSELNRLFLSLNPALGLKGLRDAQASGKAPAEHQTKQKAKESSAKSIGVLGLSQAVTASVRAPSGTTLPSLGQSMAESLAPSAEEHAEAPAETTKSRADKSRREPHVETVNRVQSPRQVDKSLPAVRASWNAPVWDSDETVKAERPRSVLASLGSDKKHGLLGGGTGGVIELRTLLLWVAASVAGRPLSLVFPETSPSGGVARPESAGSERERKGGAEAGQLKGLPERTDLRALREMCEKKGVTAGQLVNILLNESRSLSEGLSLCHLIFHRLELGV
uniref:Uncharacterized protein n=1 Tax=Chromera velia CCMP2878 TaxID=1169474 RepID=A0A0G4F068_9ALVE|eukprot:Cvel_14353.t1-p1 / transcript=Cvel_14353.t1 / gene=Cvel_14353 / organism=Chromera_velia_CCMP2878 / gene_product=hypothetical protein / transcript_product=hypothetical protein / location=Cvel_scaffold1017:57262-58786(-) / protein_length=283 / sequence_SO=supercontig / SO=protein_coding / is_pseudo=false